MRFTIDGSESLESRITNDMEVVRQSVVAAVGDEILGMALGGGYGRGEGGVYVVKGEERVYNDYDFFVVAPYRSRSRRRTLAQKLAQVKAAVEPEFGIHVDFSPPMPREDLPYQPYELMLMELKSGHRTIIGPEDLLSTLPNYDIARPPLEEGTRLLMNRGVGLLMAKMLLREKRSLTQDEHEFVVRNIYKTFMAMGDCLLFIRGNYDPSYAVRWKRVMAIQETDIPDWNYVRDWYDVALQFKFRPAHDVPDGYSLKSWLEATIALFDGVFLWYERQRLNAPDLDWHAYAAMPRRFPVRYLSDCTKNLYRNLRCGTGVLSLIGECFLHPRDRILKRLSGLLRRDGAPIRDEGLVLRLWESFG